MYVLLTERKPANKHLILPNLTNCGTFVDFSFSQVFTTLKGNHISLPYLARNKREFGDI